MPQFRAKARAVDLLGKGQIADLPTAISELWKNGYDAYGDNLEASLYMKGYKNHNEPIFVISDDGKGMDNDDIIDKWFVLGTDSKTRTDPDKRGPDTLSKEPRVKMGEKGIGRLAVAYLGPQMLMLTKKMNHPVELIFFDWRILDNYNLFLGDVNIPQHAITNVSDFPKIFLKLKNEFLRNFPEIKLNQFDPWEEQKDLKRQIVDETKELVVPEFIIEDVISDLTQNATKTHATRFIVFKPEEQIIDLRNFIKTDETDDSKDDISINYTVSTLVGLFNFFKDENPPHKTHFWIYEKEDTGRYDLLTFRSFFNPSDFKDCDHLIEGDFDEEGGFKGTVRIYNKDIPHSFKPIKPKSKTSYGPFRIKVGYVQQEEDKSLVKNERKKVFEEKLSLYSGLFIYRDGFRVLPYGRPDTDFLEFEERRSKSAGDNFFSKRRMFGYIEITRQENGRLKDKSSREGFINTQAFRDFKADLIAFFKDLAKKYFATRAEYDYKQEQQADLANKAEAEKQEHEKDKKSRKEFASKLNKLPKELQQLQAKYDNYIAQLKGKIGQSNIIYDEVQALLAKAEECKVDIANYKLSKPARFKPTELQQKNFHAYNKQFKSLESHFDQTTDILTEVRSKLKVQELFRDFESQSELYKNTLSRQFEDYEGQLHSIFEKINNDFETEKDRFIQEFNEKYEAIVPSMNDAKEIKRSMKLLGTIFNESRERIVEKVSPYISHLERLSFDVNEDNLVGYYKEKFEEIKEEWSKTYELAQLGIAVEIIDHQFNALYSQLAENIKSLQDHILPRKESLTKYKTLSTAFDHLQDNYKLLQPLYRTTGRIRTEVTATELKEYTEEFFKNRFADNKIKYTITEKAKLWKVHSYESIFKPVLINIINNAIYWLQPVENREIKIDALGDALMIMNSGVPMEDYIVEDIFKLFYSNRPKGRGIGLYLAKQSLNGIGFDIEASNAPKYNKLGGACFIIKPLTTQP